MTDHSSDPNAVTPTPSPSSPTLEDVVTAPETPKAMPARVDVLAMLREASTSQNMKDTVKAQAELKGRLEQEQVNSMIANPTLASFAKAIDQIRSIADTMAIGAGVLPEPYQEIVKQVAHWIDVADNALTPLGM